MHFTTLVARVLSVSARKLQKSCILLGVAFKEQITMAGLILVGEFLKTSNTEEGPGSVRGVSEEYNVGVSWPAKGKALGQQAV